MSSSSLTSEAASSSVSDIRPIKLSKSKENVTEQQQSKLNLNYTPDYTDCIDQSVEVHEPHITNDRKTEQSHSSDEVATMNKQSEHEEDNTITSNANHNEEEMNDTPSDQIIDAQGNLVNSTRKLTKFHEKVQKKDKISKLTGRRRSVELISPFLFSNNVEEAHKNANNIMTSDLVKTKTGVRPYPTDLTDPMKSRRISKIAQITGRGDDLNEISDLLFAGDAYEAYQNAQDLRKLEKMKRLGGF